MDNQLDHYADLLIKVGVNLQPGQPLVIGAGPEYFHTPIECADFVRRLTAKAYEAGASDVEVNWLDPELSKLRLQHAPQETLENYPSWKVNWFMERAKQNAAFIMLYCPDAGFFDDVSPDRITTAMGAEGVAQKEFTHLYHGTMSLSFVVASVASKRWAKQLFPDLSTEASMKALWDLIFKSTRIDTENPVQAWKDHQKELQNHQTFLNASHFQKLHYRGPGTDLTIELPERHKWESGASTSNAKGIPFIPNMPTEEIFTVPLKEGVNGTVSTTFPINLNGAHIEGIQLTFEKGKIIDFSAKKGQDAFEGILNTDEGSRYLGEVALVSQDSPIGKHGIIFNNILFDENASCHIAIGSSFPFCIEGGVDMSDKELEEHGLNQSGTHLDMMIGNDNLDIDGITPSGETVPIFRNGRWV